MLRYRGRDFSAQDVEKLRSLMAVNSGLSRRGLSVKVCQAWNWVQSNGAPRDMVCRGLLLALHRAGHIELPAKRCAPPNNVIAHRRVSSAPLCDTTPVERSLSSLKALDLRQIRRTPEEELFNHLLSRYHYLGYTRPVGEHLKYLFLAEERPLACMAWSSAPHHLKARDEWIGWTGPQRQRNLRFLAYNSRFLLMPWVKVLHLASHLLGQVAGRISQDWQKLYAHPIHLLETFVDPQRFEATSFRAANWRYVGLSKGLGHRNQTGKVNRSIKELWVYPLKRNFRNRLIQP